MFCRRRTHVFAVWIACFAVLLSALAPSVSRALTAKDSTGSFWREICTATGIKAVEASAADPFDTSIPARLSGHFSDCPYCPLQGDTPGLLPVGGSFSLAACGEFPHPALFYQSPRPLFICASAQPRAPPAFS